MQANKVYEQYLRNLASANNNKKQYGIMLAMKTGKHEEIVHLCSWPGKMEFEESYVEDVKHCLPVGIYICGLFSIGNDFTADYMIELSKLPGMPKSLKWLRYEATPPHKFSCVTLTSQPETVVPFIFTDHSTLPIRVDAFYEMDEVYGILTSQSGDQMSKTTRSMFNDLKEKLETSLVTFNGKYHSENETIADVIGPKQEGDEKKNDDVIVTAEIYQKSNSNHKDVKQLSNVLHLKGNCSLRLFVHEFDSIRSVRKLLIQDLVNTIQDRVEESIYASGDNEEDESTWAIEKMSRRVYFTVQPSNVQFFVTAMPDDSEEELRALIKDLLDIDLEVTDMFLDVDESDMIPKDIPGLAAPSIDNSYVVTLIRFIFVLIVSLISIWIPFYLNKKDE